MQARAYEKRESKYLLIQAPPACGKSRALMFLALDKVINQAIDYTEFPFEAEINVVLTDNDAIWEINKEYRNIDRPTDVLSFPMLEYEMAGDFSGIDIEDETLFDSENGEIVLGDIMISIDKIKSQAEEYGHSQKRELAFLVAHSMLHLFGYDHMTDEERVVMEDKQRQILDILGITR